MEMIQQIFTFGDKTEEYDGISGKEEEFIVPATGYYRLEVWGAQGGGSGGGYYGATAPTDTYNAIGKGGSGYIGNLLNGICLSGTAQIPNYTGTETITGNSGNGYAKITLMFY